MATAISFPVNGSTYVRLDFSGTNCPSRTSKTVIFDVYIYDQLGYYGWWWDHNGGNTGTISDWDFGAYNIGCHPYPGGNGSVNDAGKETNGQGSAGVNHYFEIAGAGEASDWLATSGSSTVYPSDAYEGTWLKQAYTDQVVSMWGDTWIERRYYTDLSDPSKVIIKRQLLSALGSASSPKLCLGGSPWRQFDLDENAGAAFRNIQIYSATFTSATIVSEANGTNATTPVTTSGTTYVFYRNLNPTSADISDKSGQNHNPYFATTDRPSTIQVAGDVEISSTVLSGSYSIRTPSLSLGSTVSSSLIAGNYSISRPEINPRIDLVSKSTILRIG